MCHAHHGSFTENSNDEIWFWSLKCPLTHPMIFKINYFVRSCSTFRIVHVLTPCPLFHFLSLRFTSVHIHSLQLTYRLHLFISVHIFARPAVSSVHLYSSIFTKFENCWLTHIYYGSFCNVLNELSLPSRAGKFTMRRRWAQNTALKQLKWTSGNFCQRRERWKRMAACNRLLELFTCYNRERWYENYSK